MQRMKELMARFRTQPPSSLGGVPVARRRDYLRKVISSADRADEPLAGPTGDLVFFDLAVEGNYVAVRPSGTEPIIKFYMFAYSPPCAAAAIPQARAVLEACLDDLEADLRSFAGRGW